MSDKTKTLTLKGVQLEQANSSINGQDAAQSELNRASQHNNDVFALILDSNGIDPKKVANIDYNNGEVTVTMK